MPRGTALRMKRPNFGIQGKWIEFEPDFPKNE